MTQTARGIYDSRVPWSTLLQEISLVIPDNVRLQSLTGTVPASMLPGPAVAPGAPAAAARPTSLSRAPPRRTRTWPSS